MRNLVENFKHFLTEEKSVYEVELRVKAQPGMKYYGSVFEAIRGVEGVTVIRSTEKIQKDPHDNKLMSLYVRFYVNPAYTSVYIKNLKNVITGMTDSEGNRITYVDIRTLPKKVDDLFK